MGSMHTHTCLHICMCFHMYIYIICNVCVYVHTHMHVCIHNRLSLCVYPHDGQYIYTYKLVFVCMYIHTHMYVYLHDRKSLRHFARYGVATISRLLKITGLFCKKDLQKRQYFAKETYDLKEVTKLRHPICVYAYIHAYKYPHKRTQMFTLWVMCWLIFLHPPLWSPQIIHKSWLFYSKVISIAILYCQVSSTAIFYSDELTFENICQATNCCKCLFLLFKLFGRYCDKHCNMHCNTHCITHCSTQCFLQIFGPGL